MKINQYLEKIESGRAINLDAFIKQLPFSDADAWRKIYSAERVSGGYRLAILDSRAHNALYREKTTNRVSAAKVGDSHRHSSSFGHLLVLNAACEGGVPFVVVSTEAGFSTNNGLNSKAVLVENIENFYRYQEYFEAIGRSELIEDCDIVFAAGNQINDKLHLPFLSRYQALYCSQDLDLGGLTIFKTLKSHNSHAQWLSPDNWDRFSDCFRFNPKDVSNLTKAIALARELGLNQEADLMNKHRAFVEQESFLDNKENT